jgi:hypothetical protein
MVVVLVALVLFHLYLAYELFMLVVEVAVLFLVQHHSLGV